MAHGKRVRKLCIGKVVVKNDFFKKKSELEEIWTLVYFSIIYYKSIKTILVKH